MKQQMPSRTKVSLAFDGWISKNTLAITSFIAYCMHRNWTCWEVQLALDKVDNLFFSYIECYLRLSGHGPTYWSKTSDTVEGGASSFLAYWRQLTHHYDRQCCFNLVQHSGTALNPWSIRNYVSCNEKPHTVHGAQHSAWVRSIHEQSQVKGHAKSWEPNERNQQFGENETTDIGNSQRLQKEGNARINKVLAMHGLAKIIEKEHISKYCEWPETDI